MYFFRACAAPGDGRAAIWLCWHGLRGFLCRDENVNANSHYFANSMPESGLMGYKVSEISHLQDDKGRAGRM